MERAPGLPSPYVGLVPYSEDDAPYFFGREEERDTIIENLRASRLTLLYGTSGVGKSSVLNAGVVYKLRQLTQHYVMEADVPEFAVVIFNGWRDDPIPGLMRAVQDAVARALQMKSVEPVPESRNLGEMLKAWTDRYGIELLIILDQFEEYFQYRAFESGEGTFDSEFPQAVNRADLPAKFLISIRDDALSRLDRFRTQIPNLFSNMLRISQMRTEEARKAIKEPVEEYNRRYVTDGKPFTVEPALVDEIIKQIKADPKLSSKAEGTEITAGEGKAGVETTYLQLVMIRLWEKEIEEKSRVLRLDTLNKLEGLRNIVQVYLAEAMKVLSEGQQKIAAHAFDYLVTASGTKVAYIESDLAARLAARHGVGPVDLNAVLVSLTKSRILRPVEPPADRPKESRYEVFHDVLAQAILKWLEQYNAASELAEAERTRREEEKVRRFRQLLLAMSLFVALISGLSSFAFWQRNRAVAALKETEIQRITAQEEGRRAQDAASLAELKRVEAEQAKSLAEQQRIKAEEAVVLANKRLKEIERLRDELKETARRLAVEEEDPERQQRLAQLFGIRLPTRTQQRELAPVQDEESRKGRPATEISSFLKKLWAPGRTLHIRFLDGDPNIQEKVKQIAQEWTRHANLKFEFDNSPNAEIRITFKQPGSWSYIGTDALIIPKGQPTMNFGYLRVDTPEKEFRRTVLHEFGHVLCLIHEHQNPNANIPWNRDAVIKINSGPPNYWDRAAIDAYYFQKYSGNYRPFDPISVMAYPMPKEYFLRGFEIKGGGGELSEGDKQIARELYPSANQ